MKELLVLLHAIKAFAKDLHYDARGQNFWSDHKLADEIVGGLDDFMDEINEIMMAGTGAPSQRLILMAVAEIMPAVSPNWVDLQRLIDSALNYQVETKGKGEEDLVGRIKNDLLKKYAFVSNRIKG